MGRKTQTAHPEIGECARDHLITCVPWKRQHFVGRLKLVHKQGSIGLHVSLEMRTFYRVDEDILSVSSIVQAPSIFFVPLLESGQRIFCRATKIVCTGGVRQIVGLGAAC
ncbi:hypothetical protein AVEN_224702-1 [Araneus ventricosus]|uniref:Uncharacterized protein n=1 Tax=Araneus ventricosus TaxID=182803 RepID=A0A4Y2EWN0_ARAVE|nr:hypothetical protein AVEN_224702-1 [Araneus ventricosus]